jgi:hypothetical protein
LDVIGAVWLGAALGTGLALVGTGLGWTLGQSRSLVPVRVVAWWVRRVVVPLLHARSWWRRAAVIFANNVSLLAILTALGRWHWAALVGVAGLGVGLGIGIRVLSGEPRVNLQPDRAPRTDANWGFGLGIALNLLEPPAIILAIGLSLGRLAVPLSPMDVWQTFALWVVPATALAAAGESLWLGVSQPASDIEDTLPPDHDETDSHGSR